MSYFKIKTHFEDILRSIYPKRVCRKVQFQDLETLKSDLGSVSKNARFGPVLLQNKTSLKAVPHQPVKGLKVTYFRERTHFEDILRSIYPNQVCRKVKFQDLVGPWSFKFFWDAWSKSPQNICVPGEIKLRIMVNFSQIWLIISVLFSWPRCNRPRK